MGYSVPHDAATFRLMNATLNVLSLSRARAAAVSGRARRCRCRELAVEVAEDPQDPRFPCLYVGGGDHPALVVRLRVGTPNYFRLEQRLQGAVQMTIIVILRSYNERPGCAHRDPGRAAGSPALGRVALGTDPAAGRSRAPHPAGREATRETDEGAGRGRPSRRREPSATASRRMDRVRSQGRHRRRPRRRTPRRRADQGVRLFDSARGTSRRRHRPLRRRSAPP